jgi:hypothetical protein
MIGKRATSTETSVEAQGAADGPALRNGDHPRWLLVACGDPDHELSGLPDLYTHMLSAMTKVPSLCSPESCCYAKRETA